MLGPSDFRKNYSALIGTYSNAQYSLRSLVEYRLPLTATARDAETIAEFCRNDDLSILPDPIKTWIGDLDVATRERLRKRLELFFDFATQSGSPFCFADCSLGNLIFAGSYLRCDRNFNEASKDFALFVGARANLVNVSEGENRILVGLKTDGTFLSSEAQIVGPQSAAPIHRIFFLERPLEPDQAQELQALDLQRQVDLLSRMEAVPALSPEASRAIAGADIILLGPGTQHSSLLPSYRIAAAALKSARSPVKALVMNLDEDHDIAGLAASDVVDRVLTYASTTGEPDRMLTHVLINRDSEPGRLASGKLTNAFYRGARVVRGAFATPYRPHVHNGAAITDAVISTWKSSVLGATQNSVEVYLDMNSRSGGVSEAIDDFLEIAVQLADTLARLHRAESSTGTSIRATSSGNPTPDARR